MHFAIGQKVGAGTRSVVDGLGPICRRNAAADAEFIREPTKNLTISAVRCERILRKAEVLRAMEAGKRKRSVDAHITDVIRRGPRSGEMLPGVVADRIVGRPLFYVSGTVPIAVVQAKRDAVIPA